MFHLLKTPICQPLPSAGITRPPRYYGLIRLPIPLPMASSPRLPVPPLLEESIGPPRFLAKSLGQHAMDYDPGGVSVISPHNDDFVAAFGVLNHLDLLHNISIFGAGHLHPCGLRPTVSLFTLHLCDYPHRRKTRYWRSANFARLASQPTGSRRLGLTMI